VLTQWRQDRDVETVEAVGKRTMRGRTTVDRVRNEDCQTSWVSGAKETLGGSKRSSSTKYETSTKQRFSNYLTRPGDGINISATSRDFDATHTRSSGSGHGTVSGSCHRPLRRDGDNESGEFFDPVVVPVLDTSRGCAHHSRLFARRKIVRRIDESDRFVRRSCVAVS
jgi:hypothetical protein